MRRLILNINLVASSLTTGTFSYGKGVRKDYKWNYTDDLEPHTAKKHQILRQYFKSYLETRCNYPAKVFKIIIVDGFAGAGRYSRNEPGSSIIFIEVLREFVIEQNVYRQKNNMYGIHVDCILCMNELDKNVLEQLKVNVDVVCKNMEPVEELTLFTEYFNQDFNSFYWQYKNQLHLRRCNNVFFNLDQCGYTQVDTAILRDIIASWKSAEIVFTFMIKSMLAFLSPKKENSNSLEPSLKRSVDALNQDFSEVDFGKTEWLGRAEKIVFDYLGQVAPFVSPFSIDSRVGWRYWLMHMAGSYRARQVFNNVLHQDTSTQAHYGRAGLKMLSYTTGDDAQLYLFNETAREIAKHELHTDIPKVVMASGDMLPMDEFYKITYNETPAHSDDIHEVMIDNDDIEILTGQDGGKRRKPNTIVSTDFIRLKKQPSLFFFNKQKELFSYDDEK